MLLKETKYLLSKQLNVTMVHFVHHKFNIFNVLVLETVCLAVSKNNQRTNGPVNAHLISWPSRAQNIQNLENIL